MKLTIELKLTGGEPVASSEVARDDRNFVHAPQTADTRQATLRQALEAAVHYVTQRARELSEMEVTNAAASKKEKARMFGKVAVTHKIEDK